jgi:hypothetical protein
MCRTRIWLTEGQKSGCFELTGFHFYFYLQVTSYLKNRRVPRSLSTAISVLFLHPHLVDGRSVAKPGSLVFLLLFLVLDTVSGASDDISRHDMSWRCVGYRLTGMVTTKEPAGIR